MIFSRVLPFFALALSFSFMSVAKPVAETDVVKRVEGEAGAADVATVITTLKAATDSILPQIEALCDSGNADTDTMEPLFHKLINAFTTADASLIQLKGKVNAQQLETTKAELVALIASIIIDVVMTLNKVLIQARNFLPTLSTLKSVLDLAMKSLLLNVDSIFGGVMALVAGLLVDVVGLLTAVGLRLVVALLGL